MRDTAVNRQVFWMPLVRSFLPYHNRVTELNDHWKEEFQSDMTNLFKDMMSRMGQHKESLDRPVIFDMSFDTSLNIERGSINKKQICGFVCLENNQNQYITLYNSMSSVVNNWNYTIEKKYDKEKDLHRIGSQLHTKEVQLFPRPGDIFLWWNSIEHSIRKIDDKKTSGIFVSFYQSTYDIGEETYG